MGTAYMCVRDGRAEQWESQSQWHILALFLVISFFAMPSHRLDKQNVAQGDLRTIDAHSGARCDSMMMLLVCKRELDSRRQYQYMVFR
jgi:hypothetical protein